MEPPWDNNTLLYFLLSVAWILAVALLAAGSAVFTAVRKRVK